MNQEESPKTKFVMQHAKEMEELLARQPNDDEVDFVHWLGNDFKEVSFDGVFGCMVFVRIYEDGRKLKFQLRVTYPDKNCSEQYFCSQLHETSLPVTSEDHLQVMNKAVEILKRLKFDKFSGKIYDRTYTSVDIQNIFAGTALVFPDGMECISCYEMTLTKTICEHPICIACLSELMKSKGFVAVPCPICRRYLGESDDEDDD